MAKLSFIPTPIDEDFQYLPPEGTVPPENPQFVKFRRKYYQYQFEFISRIKDKSGIGDRISLYKKLATDSCNRGLYGMSINNDTYMKRFDMVLKVDFKLSMRESFELFQTSMTEIWEKIEDMYKAYRLTNTEYLTEYPLKSNDRSKLPDDIFDLWKETLKVYDLSQHISIKSAIAREMGWDKIMKRGSYIEKVRDKIKYANRLIEAASAGRLYEEACIPMTVDKTRP